MTTTGFVARRVTNGTLLLAAVLVLNFLLVHLAPGDPAEVLAGEMGASNEKLLAEIRQTYRLDRPILEQLAHYLARVLRGDLGTSLFFDQPVAGLVSQRIAPSMLLIVSSQFLAVFFGLLLGVIASQKPQGAFSSAVTILTTVGYAVPVFVVGILLIIVFSSIFALLPAQGMTSARLSGGSLAHAVDVARHLVLPATTLAIVQLAQYARIARASMIDQLDAGFIRAARARGIPEKRIVFRHALRNALLPIITVTGSQIGNLISGAVLIEIVFNWPGLGSLAFDSILRRDFPTYLGILFFAALMVVVVNLIVDLSYRFVDPRVRIGTDRR